MAEQRFDEITVERINVVEPDGTLRLAICNSARMADPVIDGEALGSRAGGDAAGLIYFNNEGDECGGFIWEGRSRDGQPHAGAILTMDRFKQDQVVALTYQDSPRSGRNYGLAVWDRSDTPLPALIRRLQEIDRMDPGPDRDELRREVLSHTAAQPRVWVGRDGAGSFGVTVSDSRGQDRIRMVVDDQDEARLEFLDREGNVIYSLPPASGDQPEVRH